MTFGFENEYFLRNKDGKILEQIPSYNLPYDNYGVLVEVRSDPCENPLQTLASFNAKYTELEAMIAKYDCTLANLNEHPISDYRKKETAGFHIHFGQATWHGNMCPANDPLPDMMKLIERLDIRFETFYKGIQRHPHWFRSKPYGFEYRRLPATIDPMVVTQVLVEEFWSAAQPQAA
jgi:hypothetical protein